MPLEVTPVYRNLRTRVTFFGLEAEDLFAVLAAAVILNIFGRFLNREMFGVPMNMVLQYVVPLLMVPALMLFKYGKRSEEHTSELQSRLHLVCRLLLEKK